MIYFLKFFHVLIAITLMASMLYSFCAVILKKPLKQPWLLVLLCFSIIALISGSFLVYPTHFTFHTPWIQAANLFVLILIVSFLLLLWKEKWRSPTVILVLLVVLVLTTHDAVTKSVIWQI